MLLLTNTFIMKTIDLISFNRNMPDSHPILGDDFCAVGVYAHGDLSAMMEYDVVGIPFDGMVDRTYQHNGGVYQTFNVTLKEGIHDCILHGIHGSVKCKLYYWLYTGHDRCEHRGLVVMESDVLSVEYAEKCYYENVPSL